MGGGDRLAEAEAHRAVGAGVEAGLGTEHRQHRQSDIHRAGALGRQDRVPRHPGGDVLEGAVVGRRGAVVVDLRLDLSRVFGRRLADHLPPWRFF